MRTKIVLICLLPLLLVACGGNRTLPAATPSPEVASGKVVVIAPSGASVTLSFWDDLGRTKLLDPIQQLIGPYRRAEFEGTTVLRPIFTGLPVGDYPINVRADIIVRTKQARLHFWADMDVSRGGLFWIVEEENRLVIDRSKTSFYPLTSPGPYPPSLKEAMEASLVVLPEE